MSVPENELGQGQAAPAQPANAGLSMAEIDARLQQRDQALLNTMAEVMAQAFEQHLPSRQARDEEVRTGERKGRPTREEFEADPLAVMERFTNEKVAGLAANLQQQPHEDPAAKLALIELRKRQFYENLPPEDHVYIPFFEQYILDLDPRGLVNPKGLDMAWRMNKSYAQDYFNYKENERSYRAEQAALAQSGGRPRPNVRARLDPVEQHHAGRMGVTPEDYADYSSPQFIDI